jgi:arylsulfatase
MRCPLRLFPAVAGSLLLLAKAEAGEPRPNFVFILADDLGYSDLGCYGGELATPNLDKLARGGLRFTQFYNTARCWPSRAALMTGCHAQAVRRDTVPGVKSGGSGIRPPWAPLFTEPLRKAGYRNYHSGKWHIDGQPLENGFDHSYEIGSGENNYFKARGNTEDGLEARQTPNYYSTTAVADHSIKSLREHERLFPDKPFFLYLAFTAPHFPLQAPQSDIAKYQKKYLKGWNDVAATRHKRLVKLGIAKNPLPEMERQLGPPYDFPDAFEKLGPNEVGKPLPWTEMTPSQREFQAGKMAVHAAMVDRMDREIGRVVSQLKLMGAYENTVIFFASDNGASAEIMVRGDGHDRAAPQGSADTFLCLGPGWSSAANTPFRRHKTWVHEGGISTPLIVHWPAGIRQKGGLRGTPSHLVDIKPTILDLAGIPSADQRANGAPEAPGRSLVQVLTQRDRDLHEFLWWEHEGNRALRAGDWKLVKDAKGAWELYDLSVDRGESRNVAAAHPEKVVRLEAIWNSEAARNRDLALDQKAR